MIPTSKKGVKTIVFPVDPLTVHLNEICSNSIQRAIFAAPVMLSSALNLIFNTMHRSFIVVAFVILGEYCDNRVKLIGVGLRLIPIKL